MASANEDVNRALGQYRAYLETLSCIQIDPRLRAKFGLSDVIAQTLLEAYQAPERIRALGPEDQRRWLRRMLVNNLRDEIDRWLAAGRDVALEQPLQAAAEASSSRLSGASSRGSVAWSQVGSTYHRPLIIVPIRSIAGLPRGSGSS
jgi:hypothetical protein